MKLNQEPAFSPITLTFETREEARLFWSGICSVDTGCGEPDSKAKDKLFRKISDWFSNEAHL